MTIIGCFNSFDNLDSFDSCEGSGERVTLSYGSHLGRRHCLPNDDNVDNVSSPDKRVFGGHVTTSITLIRRV